MIDTTILHGKKLLFNVGVEYQNKEKSCRHIEYYNSIQLKFLYNKSPIRAQFANNSLMTVSL